MGEDSLRAPLALARRASLSDLRSQISDLRSQISDLVGPDAAAEVGHKGVHEEQVVLRGERHVERLVLLEEVVQVGAAVRDGLALLLSVRARAGVRARVGVGSPNPNPYPNPYPNPNPNLTPPLPLTGSIGPKSSR